MHTGSHSCKDSCKVGDAQASVSTRRLPIGKGFTLSVSSELVFTMYSILEMRMLSFTWLNNLGDTETEELDPRVWN